MGPKHNRVGKAPSGDREREQIRLLWALLEWVVQQLGFIGQQPLGHGQLLPEPHRTPHKSQGTFRQSATSAEDTSSRGTTRSTTCSRGTSWFQTERSKTNTSPSCSQSTHSTHTRVRGTTWSTLANRAVAPRGSAPKTAAKQPAAKQISAMNEADEAFLSLWHFSGSVQLTRQDQHCQWELQLNLWKLHL
ncbi:unnamed protein product [Cladocopium goreaui]|uniref:Uncharacterized protein n=1 Tax=Cladocopium goreaui TaxID=2562237 RepID=A0A9P1GFR8_9DINO|nr:unnamed protein product [Cladocopium goreaui]